MQKAVDYSSYLLTAPIWEQRRKAFYAVARPEYAVVEIFTVCFILPHFFKYYFEDYCFFYSIPFCSSDIKPVFHLLTPFQPFHFFLRNAPFGHDLDCFDFPIYDPLTDCSLRESKDFCYFSNAIHYITSFPLLMIPYLHTIVNLFCEKSIEKSPAKFPMQGAFFVTSYQNGR